MKSNIKLVKWVKKYIGALYWYGTFGQKASLKLYITKKRQYPSMYKWFYKPSMKGKICFDCAGLIKSFLMYVKSKNKIIYNPRYDLSANGFYNTSKKKGKLNTMPDIVGLGVWRNGHVGVYIGNGYVVEARGHAYGVQLNKLKDRTFTHWFEIIDVSYNYDDYKKQKDTSKSTTETKTQSSKYFKKYTGSSNSIVDALNSIKAQSSFSYRKKIAKKNKINKYIGSAKQNTKMLSLLKQGKLLKP